MPTAAPDPDHLRVVVFPETRAIYVMRGIYMVLFLAGMVMCIVVGVMRWSSPPSLAPSFLILGIIGGILVPTIWLGQWVPLVRSARLAADSPARAEWLAFSQGTINHLTGGRRLNRGWVLADLRGLEVIVTWNWFSTRAKGRQAIGLEWSEVADVSVVRINRFFPPLLRIRATDGTLVDVDVVPPSGFSARRITERELGEAVAGLNALKVSAT